MADAPKEHARNFVNGIIAGIASVLPGVSGGLILVLCGCYERLIEDIGNLRRKLVPEFMFLLFLGLGLLVGMLLCTVFLDYTMDLFAAPMMALFFGLILAQIPEVMKLTGCSSLSDADWKSLAWLALGLGFIVVLMLVNGGGRVVDPDDHSFGNMVLFASCGIVLAISKIMPGISGSSLLIALGLFDLTISSVAHLDMYFIVPLCIGLLIGILGFAKVMNYALKHYGKETYMLILGLTVGSLLIILQELAGRGLGPVDWIICVVMGVAGVAISYMFTLYGRKYGE